MRDHAVVAPDPVLGVSARREATRRARRLLLGAERHAAWLVRPSEFPRPRYGTTTLKYEWFDSRVALRRTDPHADPVLDEGKAVNVARAAHRLNGVVLHPGTTFSFWRSVGPLRARAGYEYGAEVRGGCVVPSMGGGVCLLSNLLFRAAATVGWEVVERHGHTLEVVPGSEDLWGLDATVGWPAFDLRFRSLHQDPVTRLVLGTSDSELRLRIEGDAPLTRDVSLAAEADTIQVTDGVRIRQNVIRRTIDGGDHVIVATNRKRLLHDHDLSRTCRTCGISGCSARVEIPVRKR